MAGPVTKRLVWALVRETSRRSQVGCSIHPGRATRDGHFAVVGISSETPDCARTVPRVCRVTASIRRYDSTDQRRTCVLRTTITGLVKCSETSVQRPGSTNAMPQDQKSLERGRSSSWPNPAYGGTRPSSCPRDGDCHARPDMPASMLATRIQAYSTEDANADAAMPAVFIARDIHRSCDGGGVSVLAAPPASRRRGKLEPSPWRRRRIQTPPLPLGGGR